MRFFVKSLLMASVAGSIIAPEAFAQSQVYIESLNFGGSGCAQADSSGALYDVNNDGFPDRFEIIFDNYIAEQGPGIPISRRRRNCNISVGMHLPQGYQFSIFSVNYQGYADLAPGVQGSQRSDYQFIGYTGTVTLQTILNGYYQSAYSRNDVLGISSIVWSPCGLSVPLNIRTQVALAGRSPYPPSAMTVDQTTGEVHQIYGIMWRRCKT